MISVSAQLRVHLGCCGVLILLLACQRSVQNAPAQQAPPMGVTAEAERSGPTHQADLPANETRHDVEVDGVDGTDPPHELGTSDEYDRALGPLRSWVASHRAQLFVALFDLKGQNWLIDEGADKSVNVASNAKLVTAAAALSLLGPAHTFSTEVFANIDRNGRCSRLVLRGGGAPDLSSVDLYRFVAVVKGRGAREVEHIVVDQSLFEGSFVPPGFEQQPGEWAPFRANVSALAVNHNSVTLNVWPTEPGHAARVWYEPPGVVEASGTVVTAPEHAGDRVHWALDPQPAGRLASKLSGQLGMDAGRRKYQRRLDDPSLAGGLALRALLADAGITVGDVALGVREREPRLTTWASRPVAELVRKLGKESDNFTAEMLLIALSQARGDVPPNSADPKQRWSSERGAVTVEQWLKRVGIWTPGMVVKNGSGLFDANRYSPRSLVSLLGYVEDHPEIYHDFVSQLAMGGTDGTLKQRLRGNEFAPRVRAKTGTLNDVDALTGYVGRPGGEPPLAFSVVVIHKGGEHAAVRDRMDQAVLRWAALAGN